MSLNQYGWVSWTEPLPKGSEASRRREHFRSHLKKNGLVEGMAGFPPCAVTRPPSKAIDSCSMYLKLIQHSLVLTKDLKLAKKDLSNPRLQAQMDYLISDQWRKVDIAHNAFLDEEGIAVRRRHNSAMK